MKLKGGIIIIGSLLWDNSTKRRTWRNNYFNSMSIPINVPIRYGRISSSRMNTYTMIYSANLKPEEYGKGVVLKMQNNITDFLVLRDILENTIRIERDKTKEEWKYIKKGEAFTLNWNWGVVGLSINPKHIMQNSQLSPEIEPITNYWINNLSDFNPSKFSLKNEDLIIDKNGLFQIEWTNELDDLDFLFSTIIEPKTADNNYPDANQIAKSMYDGNYYSYFIKNLENGIYTKDDKNILELVKSKYNVLKYIENKIEQNAVT